MKTAIFNERRERVEAEMRQQGRTRSIRGKRGSSTYEFGPALFVLLIFIFFPLIDLISMCVSYGFCMVLNYNQLQEAMVEKSTDAQQTSGTVQKTIPDQWLNGMGHFVKTTGYPKTVISYTAVPATGPAAAGTTPIPDQLITVVTTVTCNPFLPIPVPVVNVPGLNGPMTFSVSSSHLMENPDYAQE